MNTSYYYETIARQRLDETARRACTAYQRRQIKTSARRHFPKVTWTSWTRVPTARPA